MENVTSISDFVQKQVAVGKWREEMIPADIAGTPRDLIIFRAARKAKRIKHDWRIKTARSARSWLGFDQTPPLVHL